MLCFCVHGRKGGRGHLLLLAVPGLRERSLQAELRLRQSILNFLQAQLEGFPLEGLEVGIAKLSLDLLHLLEELRSGAGQMAAATSVSGPCKGSRQTEGRDQMESCTEV